MKKSLVFLLILILVLNLSLKSIKAQESPPMPSLPIIGEFVNTNETSSLPDTFERFQQTANSLSEEESRKAYLQQEWTKILAENKIVSPVLYYTDKIFSFLNPLWELVFQQPFSWSWIFILSLGMWIILIFIFYSTAAPFTQSNFWINFIIAFCVATLTGISGGINQGVLLLVAPLQNIWTVLLAVFVAVCIVIIYKGLMKNLGIGLKEKGKKERAEIKDMKENAKEKITDIKLKGGGL